MDKNNQGCKLELEYPCEWQYKAIGRDKMLLAKSIDDIFQGRQCTISYSKSSKTGKYHSFSIDLQVLDEEDRLGFYERLKADPQVMMVI